MKKYVAFFDLDHTILDTSSARLYIRYLYKKGEIGRWDLTRGVFFSVLHRLGLFATDDVIKKWVMKYRGKSERETFEHTDAWFQEYVAPRIREKSVLEIERHKKNGALTVILSASTNYGCNPVRNHLGMDDVISTRLAVRDGLFTGELQGEYCYGPVKLTRAMEYCIRHQLDLEDAWYYGDALADIHILERVGHPVCVTPDRRLRKIAEKRKWKIEEW